ncbi:MAG: cytochrome c maturation protein CcmE [Bacteroidota bacterium]
MKTKQIIILVALAIFVVGIGLAFSGNSSVYTTFDQAKKLDKQVHIVGTWVNRDQSSYDVNQDLFQFYLQDTLNQVQRVKYYDPKPTNFETAEKVVVIGGYKNDSFVADKIIMKCPSKFEATEIQPEKASTY